MSGSSFKMSDAHDDNIIPRGSNSMSSFVILILILGVAFVCAAFFIPSTTNVPKTDAADSDIIYLTDENFGENIQQGVVLVDFYTTWCGPCQMMAPTLEKLATDLKGQAKIVKVDAEANPGTADAYGVQAYPTLFLFKDGKVVDTVVGMQNEAQLRSMIKAHLPEIEKS